MLSDTVRYLLEREAKELDQRAETLDLDASAVRERLGKLERQAAKCRAEAGEIRTALAS